MDIQETFDTPTPVIGMVHLPPLPGAPRSEDDLGAVVDRARADAEALAAGGVDGVMVENFGDVPFYPDDVPKHTVAAMTRVAGAVGDAVSLPLGINVLRNDVPAALSVAHAAGGAFVRANVHTGARRTDQGVIEGRAHETMRLRDRLDAEVAVLADVDVKHSAPLGPGSSVTGEFLDGVERGLADAAVVSGRATGSDVEQDQLRRVVNERDAAGLETPVLVGSGVDAGNVADLLGTADGAIVGTALKRDGETTNRVDPDRVKELLGEVRSVRTG